MHRLTIALSLTAALAWPTDAEGQQCVPRLDGAGSQFTTNSGSAGHTTGNHSGGANFNYLCGYNNNCTVGVAIVVDKHHQDSGIISNPFYGHAAGGAVVNATGSSAPWGAATATAGVGVGAKECLFGMFCEVTLSVNVGAGGAEVPTGGLLWAAANAHTHSCPDTHEPASPPPPPPPTCWQECHDEYVCDGETCIDEWVCSGWWDINWWTGEFEWREYCTLTPTCTPNCGWQPTCVEVCG